MALRAVSPRAPAAFCRDIAAPAARICYEELQVVAAELPENQSCVALPGLCRPTHYTGQSAQDWETGLLFQPAPTPSGPEESRGNLSYFILPHAFAASPSPYGTPSGHLPRTLRGQFGKQPYREHRALRPGGRGIARARRYLEALPLGSALHKLLEEYAPPAPGRGEHYQRALAY